MSLEDNTTGRNPGDNGTPPDDHSIDAERDFILGNVGQDAISVLEGMGLDVNGAVGTILQERRRKEAGLTRKATSIDLFDLPVEDLLVSELGTLGRNFDSASTFTTEANRRLTLLGLTEEQRAEFAAIDQAAREARGTQDELGNLGQQYYFLANTTQQDLPQPVECTTSELVLLIDDANAALARDHIWLPSDAYGAAAYASGRFTGQSPYYDELKARFARLGLSEETMGQFVANEGLILEREKWGYEPARLSWDEASFGNTDEQNSTE